MAFERIMGLNVIDDAAYQQYREAMIPILKTYGGAFGYDFRVSEVLLSKDAGDINRVFTIEFPSREAMEQFFADPDYLAVRGEYFERSVAGSTVISLHEKSE